MVDAYDFIAAIWWIFDLITAVSGCSMLAMVAREVCHCDGRRHISISRWVSETLWSCRMVHELPKKVKIRNAELLGGFNPNETILVNQPCQIYWDSKRSTYVENHHLPPYSINMGCGISPTRSPCNRVPAPGTEVVPS